MVMHSHHRIKFLICFLLETFEVCVNVLKSLRLPQILTDPSYLRQLHWVVHQLQCGLPDSFTFLLYLLLFQCLRQEALVLIAHMLNQASCRPLSRLVGLQVLHQLLSIEDAIVKSPPRWSLSHEWIGFADFQTDDFFLRIEYFFVFFSQLEEVV